jgi:ribosomal protein S18 acetylase RimI-like enzyme
MRSGLKQVVPLIRDATPDDVPALARLAEDTFCQTFVEGYAVGYPEDDLNAFLTDSYALPRIAAWIADPRAQVLVAEDEDGRLIGYVHSGGNTLPYAEAGPGDGELKRIYVRREQQGTGLGRALLERALAWLGPRPVLIGVWSGNLKAQKLYRHYGFEPVGEYLFMVGKTADPEFILRRGPTG